jgi:hypothetical protein
MKKVFVLTLFVLMILLGFARQAQASGPINFYIRGGILTESNFKFDHILWLGGANIDLHFGPILMLSPECDIVIYKFEFNPVFIMPGATLNLHINGLYAGAGATIPIIIGSGYTYEGNFLLKLNAGFKTNYLKLQAFLLTPFENLFGYSVIGATLGFGF